MMNLILPILMFLSTPEPESIPPAKYTKVIIEMKDKDLNYKEVMNSVYPNDISDAKSCLNGRSAPSFKCGYTGKISFYNSEDLILEAEFNITSCNHITYMKGDRFISKYLSKKSIAFLNELYKKHIK